MNKNGKYLVVWMVNNSKIENIDLNNSVLEDRYKAFVDSDNNLESATKFYNELLLDESTYSANICLVVKSTDY